MNDLGIRCRPTSLRRLGVALCGIFLLATSVRAVQLSSSTTFNAAGNSTDFGKSLATDGQGGIWVTGSISKTAVDADLWIAHYSAGLVLLASTTINGGKANSLDWGGDVAVDANGNVCVVGRIEEPAGFQFWAGRYSSNLTLIASNTITTYSTWTDPFGVAIGQSGKIYVVGGASSPVTGVDFWIGRLNSSLVVETSGTFNLSNRAEIASELALDSNENAYVVGRALGGALTQDAILAKFNSQLVLLSSIQVSGVGNGADDFVATAVDTDGSVLVGGFVNGSTGHEPWIGRYDSSLNLLSSNSIAAPGASGEGIEGIALDADGTILISGGVFQAGGVASSLWIAQLDRDLVVQSSFTYKGPETTQDFLSDVVIDSSGTAFAVGWYQQAAGNGGMDVWISKHPARQGLSKAIDSSASQTITLNPASGAMSVVIPSGAFPESTSITARLPGTFSSATSAAADLRGTDVGIELAVSNSLQPLRDVTLSISYTDALAQNYQERRFVISRYDDVRRVWVPLPSTVYPSLNRVDAITNHFSTFQLMEVLAAASLDAVRIFPNPFRPSGGHTRVTFSNMPDSARLRIYTMMGELVRDMSASAAGLVAWDGRNQAGAAVASGVYHVFIQGAGGSAKLKVAVQR